VSVDWSDPVARATYCREATRVARPLRVAGLAFATIAVALAVTRLWWPALPKAIPLVVAAAALLHLLAAISVRVRRPKP